MSVIQSMIFQTSIRQNHICWVKLKFVQQYYLINLVEFFRLHKYYKL